MPQARTTFWLTCLSLNWSITHGQNNAQAPLGDSINGISTDNNAPIIGESLRSYIDDVMAKYNMPGMSLGVVRTNGEVEVEGFGLKNEDGDLVSPEVC